MILVNDVMVFTQNPEWKWKWKSLSRVRLIAIPYTVHGILQARILERVAVPFSKESSWPKDPERNPKSLEFRFGHLTLLQG